MRAEQGDTFDPANVAWVFDRADYANLQQAIRDSVEVVVDLETTGLDEYATTNGPWNGGVGARIALASFTLPSSEEDLDPVTWLLPLSHPESPWQGIWRKLIGNAMAIAVKGEKPISNQNIKFDARWFYATTGCDVTANIVWDTQIAAHLMNENASTKLKEIAPDTFGIQRWDEFDLSTPGAAERVPLIDLGLYAARDTYWTWKQERYQRQLMRLEPGPDGQIEPVESPEDIEHARLGRLAVWVSMPTIATLTTMEQRGMALDRPWVMEKIEENKAAFAEVNERLSTRYVADGLEPAGVSYAATATWFKKFTEIAVEKDELRVAALTKTGQPRWGKGVLVRQMRAGSEVAKGILEARQALKRLEYLNSWLGFQKTDGRIHARYNAGSVVTGRLSSSGPNMQQVTKKLRPAFIPSPGYVIADFDYCLEGSMRVLTPELEWVMVSELEPGQKLIGFPEHVGLGSGRTNRYEETEVVSTKKLRRPSRVVMLSDGRAVACSAEHRWLSFEQGTSGRRVWVEAQNLKPGDIIPVLTEPWDEPQTLQEVKDIAYLQGFLDGEGWVTETGMGWGQLPGPVHDEVLAVSERLGIEWAQSSHMNNGVIQHRVGSMARTLNILGRVRPHRLLPKARQVWEGRQTYGKFNTGVIVVEVIDAGEQDVIAVETTTKTLIVEGLLSHNSQIELRVAAFISRCQPMIEAYIRGDDLHNMMAAKITGKVVDEVLPGERQAGKCFHPDTEVLTRSGWKRIVDLQPNEEVAQAVPGTGLRVTLEWVVPWQVYTMPNEHEYLVHLQNEGMDLRVTPDHAMLAYNAYGGWVETLPEELGRKRGWKNAGVLDQSDWQADPALLRVAVMVQADGSYSHRRIRLKFSKEHKIERCRKLLTAAGIEYKETVHRNGRYPDVTAFSFRSDEVRGLLDQDKTLPWRWLGLPVEQRVQIIEESVFWDGTKAKNWRMHQYLSTPQKNRDVMQALAATTGRKSRDDGHAKLSIRAVGRDETRGGNLLTERIPYTGTVTCLAVPSGVVLVRDAGVPVIVKNSANFGLLYGMGAFGFREYAETVYGVSFTEREAHDVHRAFFTLWDGLSDWHARCVKRVHSTGQVVSPIGRVRRLPQIHSSNEKVVKYAERAAINSPVQGFASDLMQTAAASIEGKLPGSSPVPGVRLVGTVHDSIVAELREDVWEEAAHACIERMVGVVDVLKRLDCDFDVPLAADVNVGTRWGLGDVGVIE